MYWSDPIWCYCFRVHEKMSKKKLILQFLWNKLWAKSLYWYWNLKEKFPLIVKGTFEEFKVLHFVRFYALCHWITSKYQQCCDLSPQSLSIWFLTLAWEVKQGCYRCYNSFLVLRKYIYLFWLYLCRHMHYYLKQVENTEFCLE